MLIFFLIFSVPVVVAYWRWRPSLPMSVAMLIMLVVVFMVSALGACSCVHVVGLGLRWRLLTQCLSQHFSCSLTLTVKYDFFADALRHF